MRGALRAARRAAARQPFSNGLLQMHVGCKRSLLNTFSRRAVLKACKPRKAMPSGPGPAGWIGWGSPAPGLAVGRPSRAVTTALRRPERPSHGRPVRAVRRYSTYQYISCYTTAARSRPPQSGTGLTSPWPGPALVSRADSLAAALRLCSARRERPVAPVGRPYEGGRG